jgi:hypothetical protein
LHQDRLSEPSAHRSEDLLTDSPRHGRNGSGPAQAVANRTHGSEPDRPVPSEYPSGLVESFQTIADPVRQSRRLPDRILVAVHQACDIGALDIARALLDVMNDVVREIAPGSPSAGRRAIEGMVAAHHRLWHLRREPGRHVTAQVARQDPDRSRSSDKTPLG